MAAVPVRVAQVGQVADAALPRVLVRVHLRSPHQVRCRVALRVAQHAREQNEHVSLVHVHLLVPSLRSDRHDLPFGLRELRKPPLSERKLVRGPVAVLVHVPADLCADFRTDLGAREQVPHLVRLGRVARPVPAGPLAFPPSGALSTAGCRHASSGCMFVNTSTSCKTMFANISSSKECILASKTASSGGRPAVVSSIARNTGAHSVSMKSMSAACSRTTGAGRFICAMGILAMRARWPADWGSQSQNGWSGAPEREWSTGAPPAPDGPGAPSPAGLWSSTGAMCASGWASSRCLAR